MLLDELDFPGDTPLVLAAHGHRVVCSLRTQGSRPQACVSQHELASCACKLQLRQSTVTDRPDACVQAPQAWTLHRTCHWSSSPITL